MGYISNKEILKTKLNEKYTFQNPEEAETFLMGFCTDWNWNSLLKSPYIFCKRMPNPHGSVNLVFMLFMCILSVYGVTLNAWLYRVK
jgi:hypothetical protein